MLKKWEKKDSERGDHIRIGQIRYDNVVNPRNKSVLRATVIEMPDWVNVVATTPQGEYVFVRQYRFGIENFSLEVPGGLIDRGEKPLDAAKRELLEETGYESPQWEFLSYVEPNPAFQTNSCFFYWARECSFKQEPTPDEGEDIEVCLVPGEELELYLEENRIKHALSLLGLMKARSVK